MSVASSHTVLVPGLLCSPRLFEPLLPTVWPHGAVTIADTRRDETIDEMARRLLAHAPPRFALVGVSMGGYVALEVTRLAPERITALGLISTSARPDTTEQQSSRLAQNAQTQAGQFDELVDMVFPVLVDESHQQDQELRAFWRQMAIEVGPDVFVRQNLAAIARADMRSLLPAIDIPTAVVHGRGDRLISPENGEELADSIPGAALTLVEQAGHLILQERPTEVAAAINAILS